MDQLLNPVNINRDFLCCDGTSLMPAGIESCHSGGQTNQVRNGYRN